VGWADTLDVRTEGAWLRRDGTNVVVEVDGSEEGRVPAHLLGGVVCVGRVGVSPPLLGHCRASGVAVAWLSDRGRCLARVEGPVSGNVLLRREQYRLRMSLASERPMRNPRER
jgi:CRISP-associated protein Cas1